MVLPALYRLWASDDTCSRHWSTFQLLVSSDFASASRVLRLGEDLRSSWHQLADSVSGDQTSEGSVHVLGSVKWLLFAAVTRISRWDRYAAAIKAHVVIAAWPNFPLLSAIIDEEDRSIKPGTCLIQLSPRYPSDCRLHTFSSGINYERRN